MEKPTILYNLLSMQNVSLSDVRLYSCKAVNLSETCVCKLVEAEYHASSAWLSKDLRLILTVLNNARSFHDYTQCDIT